MGHVPDKPGDRDRKEGLLRWRNGSSGYVVCVLGIARWQTLSPIRGVAATVCNRWTARNYRARAAGPAILSPDGPLYLQPEGIGVWDLLDRRRREALL
jgi:hypothetical protein